MKKFIKVLSVSLLAAMLLTSCNSGGSTDDSTTTTTTTTTTEEVKLVSPLVNYNENAVDRWCFKNSGIKVDDYGRCLCIKMEMRKRIDGSVTLIILYEMFRRYRTDFMTMINKER